MIYKFKDLNQDLLFYVMVVDDADELLKFDRGNSDFKLSDQLREIGSSDAVVFSGIKNCDDRKSIVICFKPKYITGEIKYFLRLVSHECIHATFRRFGDLDLKKELQNKSEFVKYFEWIYKSVLDCLWEYRRK